MWCGVVDCWLPRNAERFGRRTSSHYVVKFGLASACQTLGLLHADVVAAHAVIAGSVVARAHHHAAALHTHEDAEQDDDEEKDGADDAGNDGTAVGLNFVVSMGLAKALSNLACLGSDSLGKLGQSAVHKDASDEFRSLSVVCCF